MPVVRRIFDLIVQSASVNGTKKELEDEDIPNPQGGRSWCVTSRERMPVQEPAKCAPSHWKSRCGLTCQMCSFNPKRLEDGLRRMVEKERSVLRGNPEEEAKTWAKRLAEVEHKRSGFQDIVAGRAHHS
jgi:hypothetical protein